MKKGYIAVGVLFAIDVAVTAAFVAIMPDQVQSISRAARSTASAAGSKASPRPLSRLRSACS